MRPAELADDFTGTNEVILHALDWLGENGQPVRFLCCIYATAPMIQPKFIRKGYEQIVLKNATSVFSVTTFSYPIWRALKITDCGRLEMVWPEYEKSRSNDMPESYHDAGQFYWLDPVKYKQEKHIFSKNSLPVILPRHFVQDIDTLEDWETAERLFKSNIDLIGY